MIEPKKRTFQHIIRESWCKGCNICVAFCPKQVLALRNGKVFAAHPDQCIGCRMCELRCPDFAIQIEEVVEDKAESNDAMHRDYTVSPEAHHD